MNRNLPVRIICNSSKYGKKWIMKPYLDSSVHYFNLFCAHVILGSFQHDSSDFQFLFLYKVKRWNWNSLESHWKGPKAVQNQKSRGKLFIIQFLFHILNCYIWSLWWRSCLTVGALISRSSGLGLSPDRGHCVVFLGRHFIFILPLSTQVYSITGCWQL